MENKKSLIELTEDKENNLYILKISKRIFETKENAMFFLEEALTNTPSGDLFRISYQRVVKEYEEEIRKYKELLKKYER